MAIFASLVGLLGLDTSKWTKGTKDAGDDLDKLGKKSKGFFGDLKSSLGKGSTLGQSMKLLMGGGAIAGFSMAGKELAEFTGKVAELEKQFHAGKMSAGDMFEEVAKSVPVFGELWATGRNIREIFIGEAEEIAKQNQMIADQNAALEKRTKIIADGISAQKQFSAELRKLRGERSTLEGHPESDDRKGDLKDKFSDSARLADIAKMKKDMAALDNDLARQRQEQAAAKADVAANASGGQVSRTYLDALKSANDVVDDTLAKKQNLQTQLSALEDNEKKLRKTYLDEMAEIEKIGADKAQKVRDDAAKKQAEARAEEWKKWDEFTEKNRDRLKEAAKGLTEAAETPLQKYLQDMQKVDVLAQLGQITSATHDALQKKYQDEYDKDAAKPDEHRSVEAQDNPLGGRVRDPDGVKDPERDRMRKIAEDQLEAQRKTNTLTTDLITKINAGSITINFP